jgi:hypothetical protein
VPDRTPDDPRRIPVVPRTTTSLRITFAYDLGQPNGGVRLVRVERVRAITPGISTPPPEPGQSGAWFEVRDRDGAFLYYQPVHDPMPTTREAFADASGKPHLSRLPTTKTSGEFEVLVPDLPKAASFAFHAAPPALEPVRERGRAAAGPAPAEELARMAFEELRRRAEKTR